MTPEQLLTDLNIVLAVLAVGAAVWGFFKWLLPLMERIKNNQAMTKAIYTELRPNGGSSLRDAVDALRRDVASIRDSAEKMDARQWAIVSSLTQPTWESDSSGGCTRANATLLELVGRTQDQMVGNGWENIVAKPDAHRVWEEWSEATAKSRMFESSYVVCNAINKKKYQVTAVAVPYFDAKRSLIGWIGVYNNIEEIK